MATTRVASQAEIERALVAVEAGQQMAGETPTEADRDMGRRILAGEISAEDAIAQRLAEIDAKYDIKH